MVRAHSVSPFLVAAYSDEMDAVAMLLFNESLAAKYGIAKGQRMLSVNVYANGKRYGFGFSKDIAIGSGYLGRWTGFSSHIGDLLSGDKNIIESHKANIPEELWQYVEKLAAEYAIRFPGVFRDARRGDFSELASNLIRSQTWRG